MTREEALNKAINIVRYFEANFAKSKEARENAAKIIEALEQEPICPSHGIDCEDCPAYDPCENAISRQAVLDYIHRILNQGTGKKKSFEFIQKYVEKLPPVNPQPKTGNWIIPTQISYVPTKFRYKCGCCNGWVEYITNFCPFCGARMESEENNG